MSKGTRQQRLLRRMISAAALAALAVSGCQQKMADQPSFKPLQPNPFFPDERSARQLVPGTVARGHLRLDQALTIGRTETVEQSATDGRAVSSGASEGTAGGFDEDAAFVREFPIPINESVIRHGYNRYMIFCVVCHDPLGTGHGKIVERGYSQPPSYHTERLRNAPVGRLYAVVSEGYGSMPSYGSQIPVEDRWAIVAYVRALQLSQHFPEDQLSPQMREALSKALESGELAADREQGGSQQGAAQEETR